MLARKVAGLIVYCRRFSTKDRAPFEDFGSGKMARLRNMPNVLGSGYPAKSEGTWKCEYPLHAMMKDIIPLILKKAGWEDSEVQREVDEFFPPEGIRVVWRTVEEYQRFPWYKRFRPVDHYSNRFSSIEAAKEIEKALIPPSARKDPFQHLRRHDFEHNFMNNSSQETFVKSTTRESLRPFTPGTQEFGAMSRKKYIDFVRNYESSACEPLDNGESYYSFHQHLQEEKKE